MKTPIQRIEIDNNNNIYIKREDLLPFSFGGNKARIAEEFFDDMNAIGKDCIIGYGSLSSNLCRVISNMATSKGIECYIVSSLEQDEEYVETSNSLISKVCNAEIRYCTKGNVADTIEDLLTECKEKGLNPYYIYGDKFGNGNESIPVNAYKKVYKEIKEQEAKMGVSFDYIFLATGTGMTQAGLIVGKHEFAGNEKIVGISIARKKEKVVKALDNYVKSHIGQHVNEEGLCVTDDYLCGGYGKHDAKIKQCIEEVLVQVGIAMDPTYTGKAFCGMREYLKEEKVEGKNILFIHTGGTPLFFDLLQSGELNKNRIVKLEHSEDNVKKLSHFLEAQSNQFAIPLLDRINVEDYSNKILQKGYVLAVMNDTEIKGIICGYANDYKTKTAFETLFVVAPELRGTGIARELFDNQIQYCKDMGMETLKFTTNKNNFAARKFYEKMGVPVIQDKEPREDILYKLDLK